MKKTNIPPTIPTIAKLDTLLPPSSVFTPTDPPAPPAAMAEIAAWPKSVFPAVTYVVKLTFPLVPDSTDVPGTAEATGFGVGAALATFDWFCKVATSELACIADSSKAEEIRDL